MRRRDIEEGQLVGARLIVDTGLLHGVARIAKVDEIHTFHDTARVHVQTGNYPCFQHVKKSVREATKALLRD